MSAGPGGRGVRAGHAASFSAPGPRRRQWHAGCPGAGTVRGRRLCGKVARVGAHSPSGRRADRLTGAREEELGYCKVFRSLSDSLPGSGLSLGHPTHAERVIVTVALLNHPSDEALGALSLGRLAEAELAEV